MPSLAKAGRGLALAAIAGLGVYRPPADAPSARRVTGSDLTGVFVMDGQGKSLVSTDPSMFRDKDYSFRPYWQTWPRGRGV